MLWYVLKNRTCLAIGESWFSFKTWVLNFEELGKYIICLYHSMSFPHEYLEFIAPLLSTSSIIFLVFWFLTYSVWTSQIHSIMIMEIAHRMASFHAFLVSHLHPYFPYPFVQNVKIKKPRFGSPIFVVLLRVFFWVRK